MPRKIPVWTAPQEALDAMPDIDGNAYNGLGEHEKRPPKPFFWHPAPEHHWGEMQAYTGKKIYYSPDSADIMDAFCIDGKPGQYKQRGPAAIDKAQAPTPGMAEDFTRAVKDFALANLADDVGIAALEPEWVFEGYEIDLPWIISVAVEHDYDAIAAAPSLPGEDNQAICEVGRQYTRGAAAANRLRNYILSQGYNATSFEGPRGGALLMIPAAIAGGLGELGKHHSMIHPRFGSSFRLAAVATDMPLLADTPLDFGADDFCASCQVCSDLCPPDAIADHKQWVRGEEKWYVDFEKCMPYFAETRSCGICIAVCPWSRPGVASGLVKKMAKRRARQTDSNEHQTP